MRILGVDPGLTYCGIAIIETDGAINSECKILLCKTIHTNTNKNHPERLEIIYDEIKTLYSKHQIDKTVIERPFLTNHNPNTGLGTAQVAGLAMLLAQKNGSKVLTFNPKEMKLTVCGNGAATKQQIQKALKTILKLDENLSEPDAADALGLAYCAILKPNLGANTNFDKSPNKSLLQNKGSQYTNAQKVWINALSKNKNNSRMM